MSDYLWDKTGEPEEDVAQLENLLGTLKYRPRPLDIPATAMPTATAAATATTATTRPAITTIFSRPHLALAASLILTLLAGAWFVTRQGEPRQKQVAGIKQGGTANGGAQPDKAVVPNTETVKHAPAASGGERAGSQEDKGAAVVAAVSTTKPGRAPRPTVARRQKLAPRRVEHAPAPREEVAAAAGRGAMRWQAEQPLTPQQREATEQLMLALRLASAKLNYAQREMLEIGRAGK